MSQAAGSGTSPAGGLRRWLAGRTLRTRLIAGLVALLFVACAGIGVVTYEALNRALLNQVDNQLTEASQRYYNCLHPPPHPDNDGDGENGGSAPAGQPPGLLRAARAASGHAQRPDHAGCGTRRGHRAERSLQAHPRR